MWCEIKELENHCTRRTEVEDSYHRAILVIHCVISSSQELTEVLSSVHIILNVAGLLLNFRLRGNRHAFL